MSNESNHADPSDEPARSSSPAAQGPSSVPVTEPGPEGRNGRHEPGDHEERDEPGPTRLWRVGRTSWALIGIVAGIVAVIGAMIPLVLADLPQLVESATDGVQQIETFLEDDRLGLGLGGPAELREAAREQVGSSVTWPARRPRRR